MGGGVMGRRRLPGTLAVVLAMALAASACGVVGGGDDTFTIGAIYPISGRQGPGGVDEARGARLAVELANRDGGVDGRRIKLQLVDVDAGSAAAGAMRGLKADGVEIVLGTYGSTISAPAAATAAREGMLLWETGAVGELTGDDGAQPGQSFFRIAPQGGRLGQAAVEFVRDRLAPLLGVDPAPLRYAVAYVDDAYGRAVGLGAVHEVERTGGVLAGTFPYDVHRLDAAGAADLVARIGETRPDVLFVSAYLDDGVAIRKATLAAHLPLKASIGTSSSYCMPAFAVALGSGAVGLFASDKPDGAQVKEDALTDEGRRTLAWARARYHDRYHEEMSAAAL
ncbi:MAG TPA: ABC transporter substrate-binding protein, partial [Acidimicrobiales bacterium]